MSTAIIWVAAIASWVVAAAVGMRFVATRDVHCHGEGSGYNWGHNIQYCIRHCRKGCWRTDGEIGFRAAALGSLAGFIWPLLVLPAIAFLLARRHTVATPNLQRIAEMERELGIGGAS